MHIVLVYRCYNDGTACHNLTFCTKKISNDRFGFNEDGTIKATLPNGKKMDVALTEAGVYQVHMAVNDGTYWAMK